MNQSDEAFSRHRRAWELIPWVVNGRASAEERRVVERHLQDCSDCREEFEFQSQLCAAMNREPAGEPDPRPAMQRLWQRIDGDGEASVSGGRRAISSGFARGLLAAVIVEAIGIAALSGALWKRGDTAAHAPLYQTLSAPAETAQHATIRAVLAPTLTVSQLQALLSRSQLQIVGGPGEAGVYSLAPTSLHGDAVASLAQLRADPQVRFAEPINATQRPVP